LADKKNAIIFQEICREQHAPKKFIEILCACCTWPKHNRPTFVEIIQNFHSISDNDFELSEESHITGNSSRTRHDQSKVDGSSGYRNASSPNIYRSKYSIRDKSLYSADEDED
jgi:hypothetical protein